MGEEPTIGLDVVAKERAASYHIRDLEVNEADIEETIRRIYEERLLE